MSSTHLNGMGATMKLTIAGTSYSLRSLCTGLIVVLLGCSQPGAPLERLPAERIPAWNSLTPKPGEWITWGGDPGNARYSPLVQIDRGNVAQLQVVWRWQAQPLVQRADSNWKATPLYLDGVLY